MKKTLQLNLETLKILSWGLRVGTRFPKLTAEDLRTLPPLDGVDMTVVQSCKIDSLIFMAKPEYAPLQHFYDRMWNLIRAQAEPAIKALSEAAINVAAIQGMYTSPKFYGNRAFGRRSDIDLFCSEDNLNQFQDILRNFGFQYLAIDEDSNVLTLSDQQVLATNFASNFQFGKQMALSKIVEIDLECEISDLIPDSLPPLFRNEKGYFCYFGIEPTFHFGENINSVEIQKNLVKDDSTSLPFVIAPELAILANIRRVEESLRDYHNFRYHPLIEILSFVRNEKINWSQLQNLAYKYDDRKSLRVLGRLIGISEQIVPDDLITYIEDTSEKTWIEKHIIDPISTLNYSK